MLLQFRNPPKVDPTIVQLLENKYFFHPLVAGTYKDALLLEELDYKAFEAEQLKPVHWSFRFSHRPSKTRRLNRSMPQTISTGGTFRSNLIQGNMTLKEARIYIIKLIGRYFELGELQI